jgi:hypothetical protein
MRTFVFPYSRFITMHFRLLLLLVLLTRLGEAQATDNHRAPGAGVNGVVYDSIARGPLRGATVQLVSADSLGHFSGATVSDSLGRFAFDSVPDGRYLLGFLHPMLDSLGLQPTLREVLVSGSRAMRADLAIPSPARLRTTICGPQSSDANGLVVGVVRGARDETAISGAAVSGEWLELSITAKGVVRRVPRLVATTGENGWFAMCNVPSAGTMTLMARHGADSTDVIEVQVPAVGFLRRELYLGAAHTVLTGDTSRFDDTLAAPRRMHVGDGRLSGTVVTAVGGLPLAGAQVNIVDGPRTRANARGEWTLVAAPMGTRMLEVHAVSYYPQRRSVDIVAGAEVVRVALSTFKSVLDTVKVVAGRANDPERAGFMERRRSGIGSYLTPDDIARRRAIVTSDLFRMMPGVRVEGDTSGFEKQLMVRGSQARWCKAAIYLDGRHVDGLSADDINGMVSPHEIAAIEVYAGSSVPPQFQEILSGCGSIVIWTK